MFKIDTMQGHDRMSTQDLLLKIEAAVRAGETDFDIKASGQHDIGGPLWHPQGKKLKFHVTNAGQRVGSMALDGEPSGLLRAGSDGQPLSSQRSCPSAPA